VTKDDDTNVAPVSFDDSVEEDGAADDLAGETAAVDVADEPDLDDADDADGAEPGRHRGQMRRLLVPIALVVVLLASAGLATWVYLSMYRPDLQTNAQEARDVVQAAKDGTIAVLSYAPETVDQDFANAKSRLTGDFLRYYTQFTQDIVGPAVKQKAVKTSAAVVQSALSRLEPTSAEVVLFVNQSTKSKENPDGAFAASSVRVTLVKAGDRWLIDKFDPV
jgi:Mce-associated membrane protein